MKKLTYETIENILAGLDYTKGKFAYIYFKGGMIWKLWACPITAAIEARDLLEFGGSAPVFASYANSKKAAESLWCMSEYIKKIEH